ncbi:helix-turn-helix transcriptional regulator [Acidaminobacter sp. JC074]|uniref:helix-turn-helix transcriptional regulator n=1 Tax=Acidaminobacter sp. JC074 TaxID=2530199 RepID=UPI001F0DD1A3|nr:AraC family transcriptional regulator [Acidaminobacter sp. JC074]MCH4888532.1 helix-turn-helix transcriptional regulator [Acidaminobacter sp. JC074]
MKENYLDYSGPIPKEALKFVDIYTGDNMQIVIPNGGVFDFALDPHVLPSYLFTYTYHERAYVCIDHELIPLKPGGLLSVSPYVEHYEVPTVQQSRYVCINIRSNYFDELYKKVTGQVTPIFRGQYTELISDLPDLVSKYVNEYEEKVFGYDEICKSLETIIINKILRSVLGKVEKKLSITVRKEIEQAIQYMYHHMHQKITLNELAEDVNLSVSRFSKIFKDELETSPMDYLNAIRLERAKRLLLSDQMKIHRIAYECGFSDTSYFTMKFKEKYDETPREFRSNYRIT